MKPSHVEVAVIGGGQAGLSISWYLKKAGIEHVVFERHRVVNEWRSARWDSFCLVTPNWQCRLPGFPYDGVEPDGFMLRDDIVSYLDRYVASFEPPLMEHTHVKRLRKLPGGHFEIDTSAGTWHANQVVIATGGYQIPTVPRSAERLPDSILQLHSSNYRNPASLPAGEVLVVGTGQSGCQIAEDLHREGRKVHLAVGTAPRAPRRYRGREVTDWLTESGYYAIPIDKHPQGEAVRDKTNHYLSGRDGGKEIDLRQFALEGMRLYGRMKDIAGSTMQFEPDLRRNLDSADASYLNIRAAVDRYIAEAGIDAPLEPAYTPVWQPDVDPTELDVTASNITSVIWSIGFGVDYRWAELPLFDGRGHPVHKRGISVMPGVYFLGLPWQNTWGSGRFADVGLDAQFLIDRIAARVAQPATTLAA
ncbi:putative flavoprotein involved in K+ transport [Panacagrimonas perspica]|uniref:Putative flavoprotein involved in K+ transport n=1 Tax=Panacagrimonas perspica TaxID=381431 RepID=A0A4S3KB93_9GAMM|nr:MSMEG_0569 family flavin-dependent oxidoreductase [Panacagrimonas perspica]TDU32760.1 putative flavoprotein involved in K+ transport [Panacagrimonas perspica]THD05637.1 FAD-dependent oxidoreductase [Panacagrimonas perspica]